MCSFGGTSLFVPPTHYRSCSLLIVLTQCDATCLGCLCSACEIGVVCRHKLWRDCWICRGPQHCIKVCQSHDKTYQILSRTGGTVWGGLPGELCPGAVGGRRGAVPAAGRVAAGGPDHRQEQAGGGGPARGCKVGGAWRVGWGSPRQGRVVTTQCASVLPGWLGSGGLVRMA
jgi:hypothetical protein